MSLLTTFYNLIKPQLTDSPPDITVMNANWDAIDAELNSHEEQINSLDADKANKIQPNWIITPAKNGWTGDAYYRRNNIGQIELIGTFTTGTTAWGTEIATIAESIAALYAPLQAFNSGGSAISGFSIQPNGSIKIYSPAAEELNAGETIYINTVLV